MSKLKKDVKEPEKEVESKTAESQEPTEMEVLQLQNQDLNEKLLRNFAEFDNFKKRTAKEKLELGIYAKSQCLTGILSVVDSFERALQFECKDEEFKKGMEMILTQLNESLKSQGLVEIEALNQVFDPELHNAISQIEDENFAPNTICAVMQKGYQINDKVIRHAMVVVAN